jgi:hypothetical protein
VANPWPETPYQKAEDLFHHPEFEQMCASICRHGNHTLNAAQVRAVWSGYIAGESCRKSGESLNIQFLVVFRTRRQLIQWMKLLETRTW